MLGSIIKYSAVLFAGAVGMAVAANYSDDGILTQVKDELDDCYALQGIEAVNAHVLVKREQWVASMVLAYNVKELDKIIASYK